MSIWNKGPDPIPQSIAVMNRYIYDALVAIWNRIQGPKQKRVTLPNVGASPFTYTNEFAYPIEIVVTALGTVLNNVGLVLTDYSGTPVVISFYNNPLATANTCSGLIVLHPTDSVIITYTGAAPLFYVVER